jgi:membrane protein
VRNWVKQSAWPVVKGTVQGWISHDGNVLTAAMAYYAALSLFPMCLVLISVLGFVMRVSENVQNEQRELLAQVSAKVSPWLADKLQMLLAGVQSRAGWGGPIGIATLLIGAIAVFVQLDYSFDRIWGTNGASSHGWLATIRAILHGRLIAFCMLLLIGVLLTVVFLGDVALGRILPIDRVQAYLDTIPLGHFAVRTGQLSVGIFGNAFLFALIYKTMPKAAVSWRAAIGGGLAAGIVWRLGQMLLISFVIGKGYTAYGVVGSFIAVMLWMYYASAVLFMGAELVRTIDQQRRPAG